MATADEFALPYRVTDPVRSIGVVIVPVDSKISGKPDWEDVKVKMLITLTQLHKFDHKSDTCIGIIIAKFGRVFDIQWCMIEDPWTENPELRARLDTDSPFREASEKRMFGFFSAN